MADTIAAVATAPGRAAIGIVRVSGADLGALVRGVTGRTLAPRQAVACRFLDASGAPLDEGLALYFRAPQSYTGEDVLELQGHGGPVVLQLLLQRCIELGARLAQPGEFTQRAFLGGKLDLVQAEAVIDLIDASTAEAARCALRSLEGEFSMRVQALAEGLVNLRMRTEAALDFPEEQIEGLDQPDARERLDGLARALADVLDAARQGSLLREGLQIVLIGPPNVGKSSLLNRLAGEDVAIVTEIPGTTRDAIRLTIALDGVPLHIIDTAGLRESGDPIERMGMERTWMAIGRADAAVLLYDASAPQYSSEYSAIAARLPAALPRIHAHNKIDLTAAGPRAHEAAAVTSVWLSAKTGQGVALLKQALLRVAGWQGNSEGLFLARARHLEALRAAARHLEAAREALGAGELFAEELRLAHRSLSTVTGEFSADDLLGEIFSRFCIGK